MKSILMEIQPSIKRYADILSKVLKVDVEIADSNLVRVAGTGMYRNLINRSMEKEGYIYKHILKTGQPQIIDKPGESELCMPCSKYGKCSEKYEICTPIKLGSQIVGVIGLICFGEEQKNHLLNDFNTYMEFLQQISEFISITAYERKEKLRENTLVKGLNLVIDKMDRGVIILNNQDKVTHINKKAIEILKFIDGNFRHTIQIEKIDESILEMSKYKLTIDKQTFNVYGQFYSIGLNEDQFDKLFIFQEGKITKGEITSHIKMDIQCNDILGDSPAMYELKNNIKRIASSCSTVLITGESGTGKEMFARAIHNEGTRKSEPFIAINCAAIPYELLESELFGYVKGAFTGASASGKIGKFELANHGTIFLDEIGDMPLALQTKILRVLQDRRIIRIGSNTPVDIDVRVIAATNKDLMALIEKDKFREDLYYRLNVIPFNIPPLRERIKDIEFLVKHFIDKYMKILGKNFTKMDIHEEVMNLFYAYSWPGNIRELENTVEFMINMVDTSGVLVLDMVPRSIINSQRKVQKGKEEIMTLKELEKREILKAINIFGDTTQGKKLAAKKLGIGIATLYRKIDEYGLHNL